MTSNNSDFLSRRTQGIGGSDVAGIFGVSKWSSPLSIYLKKIGEHPEGDTENRFTRWGKILEDPIAQEFQSVTGKKLRRVTKTLKAKNHPFIIAHIDRDIIGENAGLEVKTAVEYKRADWDSGVPTPYLLQCLHYMYVTESDHWYIAVLIGGSHFDWFVVERDEELIQLMIAKESQFWNEHVIKKVPPVAGPLDSRLLESIYPGSNTEIVNLNSDIQTDIRSYLDIKESIKNLQFRQDEIENIIKSKLGDSQIGISGSYQIKWIPQSMNRLDSTNLKAAHPEIYSKFTKQSTFRKFKIKELSQ